MTIDLPSIACVAGAWKQWAQEKPGAREGDTRVSLARARSLSKRVLRRLYQVFLTGIVLSEH